MNTQESSTSFTAAVLAASRGIDTPTREDVPLSMSGSTGVVSSLFLFSVEALAAAE